MPPGRLHERRSVASGASGPDSHSKPSTTSSSFSTIRLLLPSVKGTVLVLGIYLFFLAFGYFQESVYRVGNKSTSDLYRYPIFLVAVLCIGNVVISATILYVEGLFNVHPDVKPPEIDDTGIRHHLVSPTMPGRRGERVRSASSSSFIERYILNIDRRALRDVALTSVTYVISMLASNYALSHVSFPTQVLVKSAKTVPVILGGFVFFRKRYPLHDYVTVVSVTVSLIVFNFATNKTSSKASHQSCLGLALLGVSLFCDSLTGPQQDHLLARVRISSTHLMFLTNVFGSVIAFSASLLLEGLQPVYFCVRYPDVISHVLLFCLSGALGQCFIFASLTAFGSLYLALITTTRKFFTVLLSVLVFDHDISTLQWFCVGVVFVSLGAQSYVTKRMKLRVAAAKSRHE